MWTHGFEGPVTPFCEFSQTTSSDCFFEAFGVTVAGFGQVGIDTMSCAFEALCQSAGIYTVAECGLHHELCLQDDIVHGNLTVAENLSFNASYR